MSTPLGSSQFFLDSSAAETGQSLRFEDGDTPYLTWTPASAGNRKTWTVSLWVKRGNLSSYQHIFNAGNPSPSYDALRFSNTDELEFFNGGSTSSYFKTNAKYRDVGAWYHIVVAQDTTQATSTDRIKIYVNGEQVTSFSSSTYPAQNSDFFINSNVLHKLANISVSGYSYPYDGYLANVCFIDGQALDPTSFGEYQTGTTLWKPKSDTDIQALTFGTNGFYLPFKQTTSAEGFNAVTYIGNSATQGVEGLGFEPDLLWIKYRGGAASHTLFDSIRGVDLALFSNTTNADYSYAGVGLDSFDSNGFTVTHSAANNQFNVSGRNYVAWAWDAGSGSAASNTDGSITSSVKANTAKGFSIVTWTGNDTAGATIGHGLDSTPEITIIKKRSAALAWQINLDSSVTGTAGYFNFDTNALYTGFPNYYTSANSTVLSTNGTTSGERQYNNQSADYVAYCFHSVSGYSKIGSYSGTGVAGNSVTGLGFKPAFLMIKCTNASATPWVMYDNTREPIDSKNDLVLQADNSAAEIDGGGTTRAVTFDADGFTLDTTYGGNNGSGRDYIYLAFADTRDATFFGDTSGNGNNWTPNYLNNTDVVLDGPYNGGNFAVSNVLDIDRANLTASEGNLKIVKATASTSPRNASTIGVKSGKWYWETRWSSFGGTGNYYLLTGVTTKEQWTTTSNGYNTVSYAGSNDATTNGKSLTITNGSSGGWVTYGSGYTTSGDIIGTALDLDGGTVTFYLNGTSQGSISLPSTDEEWFGYTTTDGTSNYATMHFNFGQDSSFAGQVTPQGNTDDNGLGDFAYPVPSGHLSLNTSNMSEPDILLPEDYFKPLLYTGTGSAQSITGLGWQPDFVWIKNRTEAYNHRLYDVIRGATYWLSSSGTNAETLDATELTSFDSDGFSVGSGFRTNKSGNAFVAWNWLAGNGTVSNTDGSITSTVSANPTAGFSVATYTGNGTSGATIGHGLGVAPSMVIVKNRTSGYSYGWNIYHSALGATKVISLDSTSAASTLTSAWNDTAPTSSVVTVGNIVSNNRSGNDFVMYSFAEVDGYSKIGSYTGNGSTDGPMVFTNGMRPAFVMVKNTNASSQWIMFDAERDTYNVADARLRANSSLQEATQTFADFLSNGFKIRGTGTDLNNSGNVYLYIAFAESPLKYANAR